MTESAEHGGPAEGDARVLSGRISSWRDFSDRVSAAMAMVASGPMNTVVRSSTFTPASGPAMLHPPEQLFRRRGTGTDGPSVA